MTGLTESQTSIIRRLFGAAPDAAIRTLEQALAGEAVRGGAMAAVHELAACEAADRRIRAAVFGPLVPLCKPTVGRPVRFAGGTLALLWPALRAHAPDLVRAVETANPLSDEEKAARDDTCDQLCAIAAGALRTGESEFACVIDLLNGAGEGQAELFASYLDLTPVARPALERLPEWVGRSSDERAAAARLAYKDAVDVADDTGPQYFEILFAHLPEPWQILRVLSAVMHHPGDRYVAVSELARFGEYILEDIDRRLVAFKAFDPNDGAAAGAAAAETIQIASTEIAEFETSIELSRDGPWGQRVGKQKQMLAESAESRLGQIEKAMDIALPLQMVRVGKGRRGLPNLADDLEPAALRKTEGLLGFFDHSRSAASQSGYGAARAKVAEKLEARLDQYVEDLLEMLRAEAAPPAERVHAYLEVCAAFMEAVRGEKAGQIVRRRAAAA
jgi:hypothetical protein